ncbi:MAG: trypsin-like serine protease [Flavobacterium sp.]
MKRILLLFILFCFNFMEAQYPTELQTISTATVNPYNNICYLHIYRNRFPKPDDWFKSTGFFIAPNIILTAAHNIHSVWGSKVSKIEISPGKYYSNFPYQTVTIDGKAECKKRIRTNANYSFTSGSRIKYDFGIIILTKEELRQLNLPNTDSFSLDPTYQLKKNDILNVAGYPADPDAGYNGDFMTFQQDLCGEIDEKKFGHNLDTFTGNSGSPIWVENGTKRIIVGVHTFGNAGTLLDKENMNILLEWIAQNKLKD